MNPAPIAPKDRILAAIDTPDRGVAIGLAERLGDSVGGIKLGLEFYNAHGPDGVGAVAGTTPLFLDLKYHDIPNTVAGAVRSAVAACRPRDTQRPRLRRLRDDARRGGRQPRNRRDGRHRPAEADRRHRADQPRRPRP